ncbi:methyl-CpG-binding domain-containing protein 5-like [Telopea speciosissima]|uniref:methyl-CpG-binding domain-containing protein 5-like n=1 Tax=Telopea speciosissima TaxID=54955 RepID=UPI001CC7D11F|nr:methyl-CpG-binding domain-containing protein 5-like [Telopea speciosissima]
MSDSKNSEREMNPSSHEPTESDLLARTVTSATLDLELEFYDAHIDYRNEAAMGGVDFGTPLNEATRGEIDIERAVDEGPRTAAETSPLPPPPPSSEVNESSHNGERDLVVGLEANGLDGGNGGEPVSVMEKIEPQSESQSQSQPQRRRAPPKTGLELAMIETSPKTPDWLPSGWLMESRIRGSGVTAGMKDRYFYDPVSGRQFRSKKEVLSFIQTGSSGRKRPNSMKSNTDATIMASESSGYVRRNRSNSKGKRSNVSSFDFNNRPAKVRWVLTDSVNGLWTPFIGDESPLESSKQE